MQDIFISINGLVLDFDTAHSLTMTLAGKDNHETMLVAWFDKKMSRHSPTNVECSPRGLPGWEEYGINHSGKMKFIINNEEYVFIYT